MKKIILLMLFSLVLSSCGSIDSNEEKSINNQISLRLIMNRVDGLTGDNEYSQITKYRITVDGEGLEKPIVVEFESESENALIENVPVGRRRSVTVEAINLNDQVILKGENYEVEVQPGQVSEAEINMQSVPIFVGLESGAVVPLNRLFFKIYSADGDLLEIRDTYDGSEELIFNPSTNSSVLSVSSKQGLFVLSPKSVKKGAHTFTVKSQISEYSTSVDLKVVEGIASSSASFFSGGYVGLRGQYVQTNRLGNFYHPLVGSGLLWTDVLDAVLLEK